jgi:hypothetical protein
MFRLKDDLWTTAFDPYFPHYSKQKVEKAYENYIEQFQNKVQELGRLFRSLVTIREPHCDVIALSLQNRGSSRAVPIACPRFRPISVAFDSGTFLAFLSHPQRGRGY